MRRENDVVLCDVMNAGPALTDHIGREAATTQLDLEEALEAARYASHPYSSYPREWPSLFEVVDTRELPPILIEKYNSAGGEGTALCGIFPEIRRAWASVDNSLFLWRFDKWMVDAQCQEYAGDEQAICSVGLAKSKPGIFIEAIQHILILATPAELILVGVCCFGSGNRMDPYEEVTLQPLPEYTITSDGVTMTCVTSTDGGRIFLAGRDGHIYEMIYTSGSLWHKRCRKVCLTTGIGNIISRWVVPNVFKFGAVDVVIEMVVDNERHILYARTEETKLLAFELGPTGDGPVKKVAEEKNLVSQRDSRSSGRQSGTTNRSVKPSIICISPMSTSESRCLHLVAVLSDGRRMFLSTSSSSINNTVLENFTGLSVIRDKPSCLKLVTTRPAPPLGVNRGLSFGAVSLAGRSHSESMSLKVETSFCSGGTVILSDSSPSSTSLLVVARDSTTQSSSMANSTGYSKNPQALRECVLSIPIDGRMLFAANIFPYPDTEVIAHSLYSDTEFYGSQLPESFERASLRLWGRGDLSIQHILPRRRIIIFGTMGMTEVVFNRPVDILRRMFESMLPRSVLEDFFHHFGAGESAAMCLLIAAKIVHSEHIITNEVSEKAAETFEDPRIVGMPKLEGNGMVSNTRAAAGGFSMGQVVQEIEPAFSGAYEGICICSSHLLFPLWELPVIVSSSTSEDRVISCRLSNEAMQIIENKIRSLETFLRTRRNQRRGLFGCVAGLGDLTGSFLYGSATEMGSGADRTTVKSLFGASSHSVYPGDNKLSSKRQRVPYSPAELTAIEVRAIECIRQLLQRCAEALFFLQLISHHHVTRLVHDFDSSFLKTLLQLTFHQLVCSEDGDHLATRLVSSLMQFYTGPDGRGTVDDISARLRDGCPSYFKESDYKFYLAVEYLERAAMAAPDTEERDTLSREAYNILCRVPESADLRTVCKRFEDLRFYEAVVQLPLQKAQAVDPSGDAFNDHVDPAVKMHALHLREQCYDIILGALHSFRSGVHQRKIDSSDQQNTFKPTVDPVNQKKYICQIIQLGVQSPDRLFHEYLYQTMIDLGLENELLEYGGTDLVPFLQRSVRETAHEVRSISAFTSTTSRQGHSTSLAESREIKYFDILARYYVMKQQHLLAARVFLSLAERKYDVGDILSIESRRQYLSKAVLQAKNAHKSTSIVGGSLQGGALDNDLLESLEGKLAVLQFQIKIKETLEAMAHQNECPITSESTNTSSHQDTINTSDSGFANTLWNKSKELSLEIKSISQLYNEYAQPFELWEICLEIFYFANNFGENNSNILREIWARLIDQALSKGGVSEACMVLKRVGSHIFPGDGRILSLDTLCLHLEKAALERSSAEGEDVGDDEVARAILGACNGAAEPVLNMYDQLLSSSGTAFSSPIFRLRLLHSVLVILHDWAMSSLAHSSKISVGTNYQGIRDQIANAANRYLTEVRRLPLPPDQTQGVYGGFCELEESLAALSFPPSQF